MWFVLSFALVIRFVAGAPQPYTQIKYTHQACYMKGGGPCHTGMVTQKNGDGACTCYVCANTNYKFTNDKEAKKRGLGKAGTPLKYGTTDRTDEALFVNPKDNPMCPMSAQFQGNYAPMGNGANGEFIEHQSSIGSPNDPWPQFPWQVMSNGRFKQKSMLPPGGAIAFRKPLKGTLKHDEKVISSKVWNPAFDHIKLNLMQKDIPNPCKKDEQFAVCMYDVKGYKPPPGPPEKQSNGHSNSHLQSAMGDFPVPDINGNDRQESMEWESNVNHGKVDTHGIEFVPPKVGAIDSKFKPKHRVHRVSYDLENDVENEEHPQTVSKPSHKYKTGDGGHTHIPPEEQERRGRASIGSEFSDENAPLMNAEEMDRKLLLPENRIRPPRAPKKLKGNQQTVWLKQLTQHLDQRDQQQQMPDQSPPSERHDSTDSTPLGREQIYNKMNVDWYYDDGDYGDDDWYRMDEGYYYGDDNEGMESYYYGEEDGDEEMDYYYYKDLMLYEESVRNVQRAEALRNKAQALLRRHERERGY